MLAKLFVTLCETSPGFKKWLWKQWYQYLARSYDKVDWKFMNYGYAYRDGYQVPLTPEQEADRYSIQLYHYVVERGALTGKDVLEVGCGRGGGAEYVCRTFKPRSMQGIDYSEQAITICRTQRVGTNLRFLRGDAEALPIPDASIDVVINIESSHCYGNMDRFLAEVKRVLRPNGLFLMADLRQREELAALDRQLEHCGMRLIEREDITREILKSIELDDARKSVFIKKLVNKRLANAFREFAGVRNSKIDRLLSEGGIAYQRFVLQRD